MSFSCVCVNPIEVVADIPTSAINQAANGLFLSSDIAKSGSSDYKAQKINKAKFKAMLAVIDELDDDDMKDIL